MMRMIRVWMGSTRHEWYRDGTAAPTHRCAPWRGQRVRRHWEAAGDGGAACARSYLGLEAGIAALAAVRRSAASTTSLYTTSYL